MKVSEITVKVNVEILDDANDLIRQIVRGEIAAQNERLINEDGVLTGEIISSPE